MACESTKSFEIAFVYPHSEDLQSEVTPIEDGSRLFFSMRQTQTILAEGDFGSQSIAHLENLTKPGEPWRFYFSQGTEVASRVVGSSRLWRPRPKAPVFDTVLLTPENTLAAHAQNTTILNSTTLRDEDRWSLIKMNDANVEFRLSLRWLNDTLVLIAQTDKQSDEESYTLNLYVQRNADLGVETLTLVEGEEPPEHDAILDVQTSNESEELTFYVALDLVGEDTIDPLSEESLSNKDVNSGKRHASHVLLGLELQEGGTTHFSWPTSFTGETPEATALGSVLLFPPFLDAVKRSGEEVILADVAGDTRYPSLQINCGSAFDAQATLRVRHDTTTLALGLSVNDTAVVVANNGALEKSDGASFYVATSNDVSAAANVFRVDVLAPEGESTCATELAPIYIDSDWHRDTEDALLPAQAHVSRCLSDTGYTLNIGLPLYAFENTSHRTLLAFDVVLHSMADGNENSRRCSLQGEVDLDAALELGGLGELRLFELSP